LEQTAVMALAATSAGTLMSLAGNRRGFCSEERVAAATETASASPPNIIIINADDLGYGDLGCYGGSVIRTPNIDRLANEGVRFTDFCSCNALCSPSDSGCLRDGTPSARGCIGCFGRRSSHLSTRLFIRLAGL